MAIDLFGTILSSAVSWGVGRILDVFLTCDGCGNRFRQQIGNGQSNTLGCKNCWREIIQFTNACEHTVHKNGQVGHVGAKLGIGFYIGEDPAEKPGWFQGKTKYPEWLFFPAATRARDMKGRQFVEVGEIRDYDTGMVYSQHQVVVSPPHDDSRWYENHRIAIPWTNIPEEHRIKNKVFAIDMKIKSVYGDVLCEDRHLTTLWK